MFAWNLLESVAWPEQFRNGCWVEELLAILSAKKKEENEVSLYKIQIYIVPAEYDPLKNLIHNK